jgi:hypothetical protein
VPVRIRELWPDAARSPESAIFVLALIPHSVREESRKAELFIKRPSGQGHMIGLKTE